MLSQLLIAMLMAAPVPVQDRGEAGQDMPKRVRSVLLYGDEQCPKAASPDEVVVCAKGGDSPYRIPKEFRDQPEEGPGGQAWTNRVETVEEVNRVGLPNSCSPVGTGGQTGCTRQWLRQWAQERLDQKAKAARVP
ncbi:hypothetical protein [Sphingomonas xinjiangensis]|uniref:Uncharacterized protein n=1 Tax=Sphingomonas xinjiangensis TaxID=643568 RepID=A0A840YMW7_9SPHN|nr:hypothetical protein [Sphingomonas xinjiangensis]MBB5708991.1 hypothetical protein [Sphingomonas xinjiangensis]